MSNRRTFPVRQGLLAGLCVALLGVGSLAMAANLRGDPRPEVKAYLASTSADEILNRTNDFVSAMSNGDFGDVSKQHQRAADDAYDAINDLLAPGDDVAALSDDQLVRLNVARENLSTVMMYYHPDRIVCSNIQKTGTRVKTKECITVGQALARTRAAREVTDRAINAMRCIPGDGQPCAR